MKPEVISKILSAIFTCCLVRRSEINLGLNHQPVMLNGNGNGHPGNKIRFIQLAPLEVDGGRACAPIATAKGIGWTRPGGCCRS